MVIKILLFLTNFHRSKRFKIGSDSTVTKTRCGKSEWSYACFSSSDLLKQVLEFIFSNVHTILKNFHSQKDHTFFTLQNQTRLGDDLSV